MAKVQSSGAHAAPTSSIAHVAKKDHVDPPKPPKAPKAAKSAAAGQARTGATPKADKPAEPTASVQAKQGVELTKVSDNRQRAVASATPVSAAPTASAAGGAAADMAHAAGGAHIEAGGAHHVAPIAPARNDPRFMAGTTGPVVKEGDAPTVKIPDGKGFFGASGRKQNNNDKEQNNYSVTDANFNNQLGLLPGDPDNGGKPLTYVQHIQTYAAAGYLEAYAPDVFGKLTASQNAGRGTVLGGASHLMGLLNTSDASEAGLTAADIASIPQTIPGTTQDASDWVARAKDSTGQNWARMHHAESQFSALKNLISAGVDPKNAFEFAGDDAVSGAGRLNGVNNQDGKQSGLNAGELEVYQKAADYQASTGVQTIFAMMSAHNMDTLDPSALTNPEVNDQIGFAKGDRTVTPERANAIAQGLANGTVTNKKDKNGGGNNDGDGDGGGADGAGGAGGGGGAGAAEGADGGEGEDGLTGAGTGAVVVADPAAALATTGALGGATLGAGALDPNNPLASVMAMLQQLLTMLEQIIAQLVQFMGNAGGASLGGATTLAPKTTPGVTGLAAPSIPVATPTLPLTPTAESIPHGHAEAPPAPAPSATPTTAPPPSAAMTPGMVM